MEIIDITNLYGTGKTRIDIIRNGIHNYGMDSAVRGLNAIDTFIVNPHTEFSFINDSGSMIGKFRVGGGICNATTTIFRAALEAGFQITERHQHWFNVGSYAWGYPENIVDAAYYTDNPINDLKFINDLDYPVMLKLEITQDGNNYQYHTIRMYTSPKAPTRKVEIFDFKKWNVKSSTIFTGSFTRKVYQEGVILREDTFTSRYLK